MKRIINAVAAFAIGLSLSTASQPLTESQLKELVQIPR
jgi:hypothetical protein